MIRETKTGDSRQLPMNSIVQGLHYPMQKSSSGALQDRTFPLDARYLRKPFKKAINPLALPPFRFYDLRGGHTFVGRLAYAGRE